MGYLAAGLRSEPWLMMPTVRLAMVSALAEKTRENFSYIRCWSRIMLMKSAAPQELARIMGVAMVRTSSRDLSKGGDQQDDHHLHDLGHEGGKEGDPGCKEVIDPACPHQPPVHQPPTAPRRWWRWRRRDR